MSSLYFPVWCMIVAWGAENDCFVCYNVNSFPFRAMCGQIIPIYIPVLFVQHAALCSLSLTR